MGCRIMIVPPDDWPPLYDIEPVFLRNARDEITGTDYYNVYVKGWFEGKCATHAECHVLINTKLGYDPIFGKPGDYLKVVK